VAVAPRQSEKSMVEDYEGMRVEMSGLYQKYCWKKGIDRPFVALIHPQ
jgi:hypothetical protein